MYIWVGALVDNQLLEVKEKIREIEKDYDFTYSNLCMPLHISLKMSFYVSDEIYHEVINTIEDFLRKEHPFDVMPKDIEHYTNIAWIRMNNNENINSLHSNLLKLLNDKYQIIPHEYDLDFIFHTTLFMDEIVDVTECYERIKNAKIPSILHINELAIGTSSTGGIGEYHILKKIIIK